MEPKNQSELFNQIWEEREHISEISGRPLFNKGHMQFFWQFSHTLPKGLYPRLKLEKRNIVLMLPGEHEFYGKFTEKDKEKPMYKNYQGAWDALFELRDLLKAKYHREK